MDCPLTKIIRAEAAQSGPMPFRRFMELALYHPELGYYASGKARIGRGGDYFTNVSVGPLFGELLAVQLREMWERLGRPPEFAIVEQGAHRGELARDVLTAADPEFRAAIRYVIVEPFARLRSAQEEALLDLHGVEWVQSLASLSGLCGVHLSNELLDALPVHLVRFSGGEWRERYVDATLAFVDGPLSDRRLESHLRQFAPGIDGYQTEVNLAALDWLQELTPVIARGFVLAIDYGHARAAFYDPGRSSGTLSCYRDHVRTFDPLDAPGELDITAHVEFTSLTEHALPLGWTVEGWTDQHHFAVALGERLFQKTAPGAAALRAFKTLMHPEMLGSAFKVLGLSRGLPHAEPLTGFRYSRGPAAPAIPA